MAGLRVKFSHMQFPSSIRQEFEKEQDGILYIILLAKTPTWIAGSRLKSRVWVVCVHFTGEWTRY